MKIRYLGFPFLLAGCHAQTYHFHMIDSEHCEINLNEKEAITAQVQAQLEAEGMKSPQAFAVTPLQPLLPPKPEDIADVVKD